MMIQQLMMIIENCDDLETQKAINRYLKKLLAEKSQIKSQITNH